VEPMYPISASQLSISDIARHWARDLPQHPPETELIDTLLRAIWTGEIRPLVADRSDDAPRRALLEAARKLGPHPAVTVVERESDVPPRVVEHEDGSATVDLTVTVVWPAADLEQTGDRLERACAALSEIGEEAFSDSFRAAVHCLRVTRDDFLAFCATNGFGLPQFWSPRRQTRSSGAAASRCRVWLRGKIAGPRMTKSQCLAEAQAKFAGLSGRSFTKLWDDIAPETWKKAGRPRK